VIVVDDPFETISSSPLVKSASSISKTVFLGVLLTASLVALGVGTYLAMGSQEPKQAPKDGKDSVSKLLKLPIVSVLPIKGYSGTRSLDVTLTGTVVPYRQITLAAEVAGRVREKSENCRTGRFVHKGDPLFELDSRDFELDVERLQALRDSEYAQQRELDQEIANAKKSLELADEDFAIQQRELKRIESLPAGIASAAELDQARRLRIASANQRQTIQNQMQLLETRRNRLVLAEKLAAAQLQQAQVNLERTKVASPIDGVIVNEMVQEDSFVQKGASLCIISDTDRVEVSCNLRTDQLLLVLEQTQSKDKSAPSSRVLRSSSYELPNTPVTISYRVSGREETVYEWKGNLSRYEGIGLDAQTRTVPIRISVDNPREVSRNGKPIDEKSNGGLPALVSGMFVDISIHTQPLNSLILVPKLALKPGNQIWTFQKDSSITANEDTEDGISPVSEAAPVSGKAIYKPQINIDDWSAGRIKVESSVKVISLIKLPEDSEEYWIAETREGLEPNTLTVVSPMATLIGDGTDKARYSLQ
jgi:multidrug efflux pump subunit AcrA (membrane-fusion protein)